MRGGRGAALILVSFFASAPAFSSELTYQPINPSFGGNPFNSAHLLGVAGAQNDYEDPKAAAKTAGSQQSLSEQFVRQLQSRLLSGLAQQVADAIFGENPQEHGTIVFGDQVIEFTNGLTSIDLTISDLATGGETHISVPTLVTD